MDSKYSQVSTVEGRRPRKAQHVYPGERRQVLPIEPDLGDRVLIKTAGNALQAVSRASLEQQGLIVVHVPPNCKGGDEIMVQKATGNSGKMISATVPEGCFPGHTFFVSVPEEAEENEEKLEQQPLAVVGVPVNSDTNMMVTTTVSANEANSQASDDNDESLVLIKVPHGAVEGEEIRAEIPDGRTIGATVPPGNVKEFYVRVPSSDSAPVAVATLV